jgi:hypothetical protein
MPGKLQRKYIPVKTKLVLMVIPIVVAMIAIHSWLKISTARVQNEKDEESACCLFILITRMK